MSHTRCPAVPIAAVAPAIRCPGAASAHISASARRAFTLFEVAISSALVAAAVVTVFMIIPIGLRAQQVARFQLYAGTKVLEILDTFANHDHTFSSHQLEGERLGQNPQALKWPIDLDRMMMSQQLGLLPLPRAIAARIDSDDDEIARILADGGQLYYASPLAYEVGFHQHSGGYNMGTLSDERVPPSEAQGVVFAVVGYAQQNGLPNHPCIAWPYPANYPSTPTTGWIGHPSWENQAWEWYMWAEDGGYLGATSAQQTEFRRMGDAILTWQYSGLSRDWLRTPEAVDKLKTYIDAVQNLVTLLGIPCTGTKPYLLPNPPKDLTPLSKPWSPTDPDVYPDPRFISAIRWLAAGALMRTGYVTSGEWYLPAPIPMLPEDVQYAKDTQEVCMRWTMRYQATNPYDWGAPRPLNRPSAWAFPLLQYDLFPPATADLKVGGGGADAGDLKWYVTAERKPKNYTSGYSMFSTLGMLPRNHDKIDASWAPDGASAFDASHFNLTQPFEAAERCRQIVCWAVDWRSFEDFESAPSGPYDASTVCWDSRGNYVDAELAQHTPDMTIAWADGSRTTRVPRPNADGQMVRNPAQPDEKAPDAYVWQDREDQGQGDARRATPAYRAAVFGLWGADRNGNGRFDKGPLPASVRIRALPIGRWNYYDRRMVSALRN